MIAEAHCPEVTTNHGLYIIKRRSIPFQLCYSKVAIPNAPSHGNCLSDNFKSIKLMEFTIAKHILSSKPQYDIPSMHQYALPTSHHSRKRYHSTPESWLSSPQINFHQYRKLDSTKSLHEILSPIM